MKREKTFGRKTRTRDRRLFDRPASEARRRATEFKLETLEERTLMSIASAKNVPPANVPMGLGTYYTTLSEQAHGVGLNADNPGQYTGSTTDSHGATVSMVDLEAYLKTLNLSYAKTTNAGAGLPASYQSQITPGQGPYLSSRPSFVTASAGSSIADYYKSQMDNPKEEQQPVGSLLDTAAQLALLKMDPQRATGISHPPLIPSLNTGFEGMNFLDSVDGYIPPDTNIGVGSQFVVEVVNAQIQFYDKATGAAMLPNTPLNVFFNQPGESPFDPNVTYDEIAGRFIVTASTFSNHELIAVSKTGNPLDGFNSYDLDVSEGGQVPDFPKLGYNADEVVLTLNMYNGDGHVQILSFAASSLFSSTPPSSLTLGTDYFSVDRGSGFADFTMVPAVMHGAAPGMPMYFVQENGSASGSQLLVTGASGLLSASPSMTDTVVKVDSYTEPPSAQQPGGSIATNDSRVLNAQWRDGLLVASQTVGTFDGNAHARWTEIDVTGSPVLVQDGTLSPSPGTGTSTYFPAVAIGPGDVIGLTYNQSSPTEYASIYDTGRTSADPAGTMQTPELAKAGSATYVDFGFRWGDYSGIAVDPTTDAFWSGAEYSTSLLSGQPANWATYISSFSIVPSVVSSSPAAGSIVSGTAPTSFSLTFSEPLDPASITAGDFTVDGTPADSASLSGDGLTITYTFKTTPIVNQGVETMSVPAGAVKGAGDELGNAAFSASFYYVTTQLQVTATSPAVGSILAAPVTDIVVRFNESFNPYTVNSSDFQVSQGSVVSATVLTPSAIDLTLSGVTHDGLLTLTLPGSAILDNYGVGNRAFSGTYFVDITSAPYPTPLAGKAPAGSLIYDPSVSGGISFAGDTDTYTLPLAANQNVSLALTVDPGLVGVVTLLDPGGSTVATATGSGPGQTVVLETAAVTTAGTYSLVVSGDAGTTGNYSLQAILNAAYKLASDGNNSIAAAYDLSGAFAGLGTTPAADRAGVLGTIDPAADHDFYKFYLDAGQSATVAAAGQNGGTVGFGLYDGHGNLLALPAGASLTQLGGPIDFGGGFSGAAGQLTLSGNAQLSGSNLELTDGGFSEAASAFANSQVYVGNFSTSFNFQITPGTSPTADGMTFTIQGDGANALGGAGGELGYYGLDKSVAIKFDLYDNSGEGTNSTGLYINGVDPSVPAIDLTGTGIDLHSGDVFNVAMNYDGTTLNVTITDTNTSASATESYAVNIPGIIGSAGAYVGFTGGTGGLTAVQNVQNWTFTPSQSPTLLSMGKFESINNFVASTAGWYYAGVEGTAGTDYSLVVTRGADFTLHGKNFNKAQQLDGTGVVLGAIVKGGGSLQALDLQSLATSPIYQADPVTGVFGSSISSPTDNLSFLFGNNMASDGTYTYFDNGYGGSGTIWKLDDSGAVVGSFTPSNGSSFTGLAYLDGRLYANAAFDPNIYIFDANTFASLGSINTGQGDAWVGLAGDPDRNVLWGVAQGTNLLYEIDPSTGAIIKQGRDNSQGAYQQDLAYTDGMLIVSECCNGVGTGAWDEYNPDTLGFIQRVFPPYQYNPSGLAGDGLGGQGTDWYQFNVNAGDNLVLTTTTPGGTTASGLQFANDLNPTINLYDEAGNLVASATGNASDGRNDVIDWTALSSGSYRVQILGATKDSLGEYTVAIQGATGGQYPFNVVSTDPAAGSDVNYTPSTMTVVFDNSIRFDSVSPSDLTIDGNPATGVTVINDHTLSFSLPGLSDGVHSVAIGGLIDIHGVALTPDSFSFKTDTVAPFIVSSSLVDGSGYSPAPATVTEVVTFSEPMNTSLTPSIDLYGEVRNVHYAAASETWDASGTVLTIQYTNLPSDAYQFNLYTSGFQDLAGNQLIAGLTTNFSVVGGTSDLTGLTPVLPLGSLVYSGTADNVLVSSTDADTYNLTIDPLQTIGVVVTPVTKDMTATVELVSPKGIVIGTATSPAPGAPAVIPGVQSTKGGAYQIVVSGGPGEYHVTATLNAYIDPAAYGGTLNTSIASAFPIDAFANNFIGHDNRTAVLGGLSGGGGGGGLVSTDRYSQGLYSVDPSTGASTLIGPLSNFTSFSGMAIDPSSGTTYISDVLDNSSGQWSLATIDRTSGQETIIGPQNDPDVHALVMSGGTLYGFSFSQGIGTMDTSTGAFTSKFGFNTLPEVMENATIDPSGTVYTVGQGSGSIYTIDLNTGIATFVGNPGTGNSGIIGLAYSGGSLYELGFNGGSTSTPLWQIDPSTIAGTLIGPNGLEAQPDAMTAPLTSGGGGPVENQATYSFSLNQGESVSVALESLNGKKGSFTLLDENGAVQALSSSGAANYTQGLNNFVAPADGKYYVQVSGDPGLKFNLVITRGADFTTQVHTTPGTAQDVTATQGSGDPKQGGALGYLQNPNGVILGTTIEGASFADANNHCGCLPPDTNAAVGNGYVVESVNLEVTIYDTSGNLLLCESTDSLFGTSTLSDPYVEYDSGTGLWYATIIGSANEANVLLAISNDSNPLDGFSRVYDVPLAASGDVADFPKFGFNAEAIVITANDFGDGHSVVTTVDKAQALAGTLVYYQSTPAFNFRALTPAQMTGAAAGSPMWFMASTGNPTYDGTTPNTIRVTRMDNVLSSSPTYTDYSVNVNTYGPNSGAADQPGAPGSVATNDVSTTQVMYLNGQLVTSFSASTPADGFRTTKVHWYQVDVTGGTPALVQEGLVDPGPGVATFFPAAAIDPAGDIGLSYMQSSSTEFVSAYAAGHIAGQPLGSTTAGKPFGPGAANEAVSFRNGDYGTVVYDPGTGSFWAANEYSGADSSSNIWRTKIASFNVLFAIGTDYYSVNANAGDHLHFGTSTPAGGPNEFVNNFYPELLLYDPNGNLVAIAAGNAADGRNSVIDFTVPDGDAGQWIIEVTASANTPSPTQGEYGLLVTGATGALAPFTVTGADPAPGSLVQPPTDIIITFNHSVLGTSLTPGELEVNGVAATAVTLVSGNTVDWTVPANAYGTGIDLANVVTLGPDADGNQVMDVSGQTLIPFSYTFFTTNVAPYVVSSSVDNQVFSPAPADVTEVVTFSQPMDTAFTTSSSFSLLGNYRNVHYAAASFSWDPSGTVLTINYANLPDDTYTLTLFAGGFQNLVGIPLAGDYTANFAVTLGTASFPTPLTPVPPLGDLIYTGSDSHVLATSTDVDDLTLALNAGETLTLIGTPTTSALQLTITVYDASNNVIATSTAPAAGANAVLETIPIPSTGTYKIGISDANGNTGLYSIQAYLNSYVKQGTSNLSIPTATDISGSSYILGPGNADRLGVVGSLPTDVITPGTVYVSSRYYGFFNPVPTVSDVLRIDANGQITGVFGVNNDPYLSLSGVQLDPVNNMLYAAVTTSFNGSGGPGSGSVDGALLEFDPLTGQQVATIPLPTDNANNSWYYPYGFSIAPDGSFWLPQTNSGNIIHLDSSYNLIGSYSAGGYLPESASVGTDGNVYFSTTVGNVYQLNTTNSSVNFFAPTSSPFGTLTSTAPAGSGIWAADYYNGGLQYDYSGNLLKQVGFYGTNQALNDPGGNIWTPNADSWDTFKFDQFGNYQFGLFTPLPIGVTTWGADNPNPPVQDLQDYYKFDLTAGQSATIVAKSLNG
jgi:hypothetical protein